MKRRIFIGIDLPPYIKEKIADDITQWRWLPIRWLGEENWHVTVISPAYLDDHELEVVLRRIIKRRFGKPFTLHFSQIILAPPGKDARMIWLEGDAPGELAELAKRLETAVNPIPLFKLTERPLHLHVTLARFEEGELKELESKTRILGKVDYHFEAAELTVMESHLKPSGAEYERLAKIPL